MEREPTLKKIGEVAQELSATPRTLRFYEEQGLVHPSRSAKGTRLYSEEDIDRFRVILRLSGLGTPLREVRELTEARRDADDGEEASRRSSQILEKMLPRIAERQRRLAVLERDLSRLERDLHACLGCHRSPSKETCAKCDIGRRLLEQELFRVML